MACGSSFLSDDAKVFIYTHSFILLSNALTKSVAFLFSFADDKSIAHFKSENASSLANEFYILEDIFQEILLNYPKLNSKQIRSEIGYALNSRNERLSEKNFEKIFGYEYDYFIFTPKNFIDELINIIYNTWKYNVLQKYYYILTKNK